MDREQIRKRQKRRNIKIYLIRAILSVIVIFITILIVIVFDSRSSTMGGVDISSGTFDNKGEYYNNNDNNPGDDNVSKAAYNTNAPLIKVDTNPNSYSVLVNREYPMPEDYVPEDLTIPDVGYSYSGIYEKSYMRQAAADALEKMFAAAKKKKKYKLKVVSAYRSYARQKVIYNHNVKTRGTKATDLVSATPGCSEHQTGLAIDVSSDTVDCEIEESFAKCPEGKWLAKNCHKYGFIIRYPKGKSDITGYSYEPWHIRYVGVNLAKYLYKNNYTLEEYYKLTTVDNKVPKDKYVKEKDLDMPDEPEMTAAPTPKTDEYTKKTPKPKQSFAPPVHTRKPQVTDEPEIEEPEETPKPTKKPVAKPTKKPVSPTEPPETKEPKETETPKETEIPKTPEPEKVTEPPVSEEVHTQEPDSLPTEIEEDIE